MEKPVDNEAFDITPLTFSKSEQQLLIPLSADDLISPKSKLLKIKSTTDDEYNIYNAEEIQESDSFSSTSSIDNDHQKEEKQIFIPPPPPPLDAHPLSKDDQIGVNNNESINDGKYEQITQRLNILENTMENLAKNMNEIINDKLPLIQLILDRNKYIDQELIELKDKMNELMDKNEFNRNDDNNKNERNKEELRLWLKNKMDFERYYDLFIKNGIEDLEIVKVLKMEDLKSIGINKLGHRIKIIQHIEKLKHDELRSKNEGHRNNDTDHYL